MSDTAPHREENDKDTEQSRMVRLLRMVQDIRQNPHQTLDALLLRHGVSRSQYYKDVKTLASSGFRVSYSKANGFKILEDQFSPIVGLTFSDRLVLMFALEHLSASGEGTLAALAVDVGRKLAGGLESPFREQLQACFDREVTSNSFGVCPEILAFMREAIAEGRRIRMLYERGKDWTTRWREVDPRHIYMRERTLYLYARTVDESPPCWKVFRLSRIRQVQATGLCVTWRPDEDDGFRTQQANTFLAFMGPEAHPVRVRFTGYAKRLMLERQWHASQKLEEQPDDSVILTMQVAYPLEVERWIRQFADEATLLPPCNVEEKEQ